mmetsp:Transcript_1715/g.4017  ORF Transcript_1715/g.4017 Transcript_1715/m.4017 type:complete len:186 (-) Transcript_1715:196-753(-)
MQLLCRRTEAFSAAPGALGAHLTLRRFSTHSKHKRLPHMPFRNISSLGYDQKIAECGVFIHDRWFSPALQLKFFGDGSDHDEAVLVEAYNPQRHLATVTIPAGAVLAPQVPQDIHMYPLILKEALEISLKAHEHKKVSCWAYCGNNLLAPPRCELFPTDYQLSNGHLSSQAAVLAAVERFLVKHE